MPWAEPPTAGVGEARGAWAKRFSTSEVQLWVEPALAAHTMAIVGVAAQLNRPILRDALAASVAAWVRACDKHQNDPAAINLQHVDEEEAPALPIVACIEPPLLAGLAAMGAFNGRESVAGAASAGIKAWAGGAAAVEGVGFASAVAGALASVKMRPQQGGA